MSNRFKHIKSKNKNVENFIEDAEKPQKKRSTQLQEKKHQHVLLSISSRMNRSEACKKPVLLHIKEDIASDIDKYCHGNKQAILNYLLRQGLDAIVKKRKLILM